jgi:hypothetical protein
MIKKVGAGSLAELFEKGCDLDSDVPYKIIELFDKNKTNVEIIKKYYGKSHIIDDNIVQQIISVVGNNGYKICDNKIAITTSGVRNYLCKIITEMLN